MSEHEQAQDGAEPEAFVEQAAARLLAATGAAREAALAELIATHPERAAALRSLCADLDNLDRLLQDGYRATSAPPAHIGGHRVLQRLGEGAFGVVYLCAQERPVVRKVAIKVLRHGAGDLRTLHRFAAERQLLAQLNHPGITQVFDAGELPDGRPFFVMEYVDGTPIHEWCVTHALPYGARLRLFADVCRAVAHAHARGIVHRDLKPANVLVVATSDGPIPKVIDFGVAKALGGGGDDGEPRTEAGRVIGTPGYMSPEQASGRVDQIDARADVFALGVMLYQLLTDQMPWQSPPTASTAEPVRPSARVSTTGGTTAGALPRHRLAAELRGDLDWITLKAIARDRGDRYSSVTVLLADIERHLRGETVSVGPPSLRYRLRKLVRRRPAAMAAGATIVLAGIGVTGAVVYASRVSSEAVAARRDAEVGLVEQRAVVAGLLQRANDPELFAAAHGDEVRRALGAEALAFAERLLATRADDPALLHDRCDALQVVAEVHRLIGEPERSREIAAQAVAIASRMAGAAPADHRLRGLLARALRQEGRAIATAGDHGAALARYAAAVEHLEACNLADAERWRSLLAVALGEMASLMPPQQRAVAIATYERAKGLFEQVRSDLEAHGATRADFVTTVLGLTRKLVDERRLDAAVAQIGSVAAELASLGDGHLRLRSEFHLLRAKIGWARGERASTLADFAAAANAADEWCRAQPRRNPAHRTLVAALDELGNATNYLGDFAASSAHFRRAIEAAETMVVQFPGDPTARGSLARRHARFAYVLWDRFRLQSLAEAATHVARALELDRELAGAVISGRLPQWRLLLLRAQIDASRGDPGAAAAWREVEACAPLEVEPSEADRDIQIEAFTGIARMRMAAGENAAAALWLGRARAVFAADPALKKGMVEVGWLEANLAFRAGDAAGAAAAADRIVKARPTWFGYRRAADCLRLAAGCADDTDDARAYGERARTCYERVVAQLDADVGKNPDDPWFVIPWGASQVRLAEFAADSGDHTRALEIVDAAITRLEAARPDAHLDQWDDDAYRAGLALRQRLRQ